MNLRMVALATSLLSLVGCGSPQESEPIRIAISCPSRLGPSLDVVSGAELAIQEFGGQIRGRRIELRIFDVSGPSDSDRVSESAEVRAAEDAAADPLVLGYIGPLFSSQAKVSIPILNQANVPQISPSASWPGLTRAGFDPGEPGIYYPTGRRTFYRVISNDEQQIAAAAEWAFAMGFRRFYILEGNHPYNRGVAGIFRERVLDFDATVVGHDPLRLVPRDVTTMPKFAEQVLASRPDMIFFSGDFQTKEEVSDFQILAAIRRRNPELAIMTPETIANDRLLEATEGTLTDRVYGVSGAVPLEHLQTPRAEAFLKLLETRSNRPPGILGGLTYEATMVLLQAMQEASEPSREGVLEALEQIGPPIGALSDWRLDPAGDRLGTGIAGHAVIDGEWTFLRILE